MSFTLGPWKSLLKADGSYEIRPAHKISWDGERFPQNTIAEVKADGIHDPNANARLIAKAPEMYSALCQTVKALEATSQFMYREGLDPATLDEVIRGIDHLLDSIDYCA